LCQRNDLMSERMPVDQIRPDNLDFDKYKEVLASDGVYDKGTNRIVWYHRNSATRMEMANARKWRAVLQHMYSEGAGRLDFFIEPIHPDEKSHSPKPLRSAPPSPADTNPESCHVAGPTSFASAESPGVGTALGG